MLPKKIISGGQTGADQAGLLFAIDQGIESGGWCPRGGICEGGRLSEADIKRFKLRQTESPDYPPRTRMNVRDSDATVIFRRSGRLSRGSDLTRELCERSGRPCLDLLLPPELFGVRLVGQGREQAIASKGRALAEFLAAYQPATLNVAGNREGSSPGIGLFTQEILASAWKQYATFEQTALPTAKAKPAQMDFGLSAEPGPVRGR
jgi:hypothetical protein